MTTAKQLIAGRRKRRAALMAGRRKKAKSLISGVRKRRTKLRKARLRTIRGK